MRVRLLEREEGRRPGRRSAAFFTWWTHSRGGRTSTLHLLGDRVYDPAVEADIDVRVGGLKGFEVSANEAAASNVENDLAGGDRCVVGRAVESAAG